MATLTASAEKNQHDQQETLRVLGLVAGFDGSYIVIGFHRLKRHRLSRRSLQSRIAQRKQRPRPQLPEKHRQPQSTDRERHHKIESSESESADRKTPARRSSTHPPRGSPASISSNPQQSFRVAFDTAQQQQTERRREIERSRVQAPPIPIRRLRRRKYHGISSGRLPAQMIRNCEKERYAHSTMNANIMLPRSCTCCLVTYSFKGRARGKGSAPARS